MALVIWTKKSPNEYYSEQGYMAFQTEEGWDLYSQTEEGYEITKCQTFLEVRRKAQTMEGFYIPDAPRGQNGKIIKEPIAYCHYHKYYMTHNDCKNHGCMKKNCTWFRKVSSSHWDRRAVVNALKKEKRKNRRGT